MSAPAAEVAGAIATRTPKTRRAMTATAVDGEVAERAKAALTSIEEMATPSRERWRDYGAELVAASEAFKGDKKKLGAWVKTNKLDVGRAAAAAVRSDAMWLAKNYDLIIGSSQDLGRLADPQHVRAACRRAGHEWAWATGRRQRLKESRAKRAAVKPRDRAEKLFNEHRKLIIACLDPKLVPGMEAEARDVIERLKKACAEKQD